MSRRLILQPCSPTPTLAGSARLMPAIEVTYEDGLLIFAAQGKRWPLPPEIATRLISDRRLIDAVRSLTTVGIVRKTKEAKE